MDRRATGSWHQALWRLMKSAAPSLVVMAARSCSLKGPRAGDVCRMALRVCTRRALSTTSSDWSMRRDSSRKTSSGLRSVDKRLTMSGDRASRSSGDSEKVWTRRPSAALK